MAEDAGQPISYQALREGTPMVSSSGKQFGTVAQVLEVAEEDLFDGIVVSTEQGRRFVDADQIAQITTARVQCKLDDEAVGDLPEPSGTEVYRADPRQDLGPSLGSRVGRMFRRGSWRRNANR